MVAFHPWFIKNGFGSYANWKLGANTNDIHLLPLYLFMENFITV